MKEIKWGGTCFSVNIPVLCWENKTPESSENFLCTFIQWQSSYRSELVGVNLDLIWSGDSLSSTSFKVKTQIFLCHEGQPCSKHRLLRLVNRGSLEARHVSCNYPRQGRFIVGSGSLKGMEPLSSSTHYDTGGESQKIVTGGACRGGDW